MGRQVAGVVTLQPFTRFELAADKRDLVEHTAPTLRLEQRAFGPVSHDQAPASGGAAGRPESRAAFRLDGKGLTHRRVAAERLHHLLEQRFAERFFRRPFRLERGFGGGRLSHFDGDLGLRPDVARPLEIDCGGSGPKSGYLERSTAGSAQYRAAHADLTFGRRARQI